MRSLRWKSHGMGSHDEYTWGTAVLHSSWVLPAQVPVRDKGRQRVFETSKIPQ